MQAPNDKLSAYEQYQAKLAEYMAKSQAANPYYAVQAGIETAAPAAQQPGLTDLGMAIAKGYAKKKLAGAGLGALTGTSGVGIGSIGGSTAGASLPLAASTPTAIMPSLTPVLPSSLGASTAGAGASAGMSASAIAPTLGAQLAGTAGVAAAPLLGMAIQKAFFKDDPARPFIVDEAVKSFDLGNKIKGYKDAPKDFQARFAQYLHDNKLLNTTGKGIKQNGGLSSSDPTADWALRIKNPFERSIPEFLSEGKARWKDIEKQREFARSDPRAQLASLRSSGKSNQKYLSKVEGALNLADSLFGEGASTTRPTSAIYGNNKIGSLAVIEALKKQGKL